jgi:Fe-S cluster assembly protein SufD
MMEAQAQAVAAEQDFLRASAADFDAASAPGPAWLAECRSRGYRRFLELGFPTARMETWRFTNPAAIARIPFRAPTGLPAGLAGVPLPAAMGTVRLVFVNGFFSAELSGPIASVPGLSVTTLEQALTDHPESIRPHLERADAGPQAFPALNAGFLRDGAVIRIEAGAVISEPDEILFVSAPGAHPTASHLRTFIFAGPHSQAALIESFAGADGEPSLTNAVTTIACGEASVLEHSKLQQEASTAFHVHSIRAIQQRASNFVSHNVATGSGLARTDLSVVFEGEGAECTLNGLFVGGGTQHLDNHTVIDHAAPRCTSRELYKGILDGRARGVFDGKIIVRAGAQKTDAMQTNKNLLLSREALVDSTPALEIFADDVKCKHGSTIGQLDPAALFYLRSRGIGEAEARALLTYAFASDVAGRIRVPALRSRVQDYLGSRLPAAGEVR